MYKKMLFLFAVVCLILSLLPPESFSADYDCEPTPPDALGPFYKPDAPIRDSVGTGYELAGKVKSAKDCSPISNAKIEIWLTGPDGNYDDEHRATLFTGEAGEYKFQSNFPEDYGFRPSHIHIRVVAEGYETLVTQHYPKKGSKKQNFDLVLKPEN